MKIFSITEAAYDIADDVMMGDPTPIKYCGICKFFNQHAVYDSITGNVKASEYGTCYVDQHVHTVGDKDCPGFCHRANA